MRSTNAASMRALGLVPQYTIETAFCVTSRACATGARRDTLLFSAPGFPPNLFMRARFFAGDKSLNRATTMYYSVLRFAGPVNANWGFGEKRRNPTNADFPMNSG